MKKKIKIEYGTYQIPGPGGTLLITHDKNMIGGVLTRADENVINPPAHTVRALTSADAGELAGSAIKLIRHIEDFILIRINKPRALFVKDLRMTKKYSWRSIALRCFAEWGGNWGPPDNQIVGQRICQQASQILGEFVD